MSRECRRVAPDWEPERNQYGHNIGLFDGSTFEKARADWLEEEAKFAEGLRRDYFDDNKWVPVDDEDRDQTFAEYHGDCPDPEHYMPVWTPEQATHWRMFETVTEGSPVSPAFETPEEVAQWCVDHPDEVNSGGTYEQWLAVCHGAFAPSGVSINGGPIMSGVEAIGR